VHGRRPVLRAEGIERPAIGPITLTIDDGECVALMGPSDAGKSLLLRALADLDPNHGTVVAGTSSRATTPAPEWRRLVSYVPAEPGWWAASVAEHFPDRTAAEALLDSLALPSAALDWPLTRLSTGERQRVALARCRINEPSVLLLDEPTAALDQENRALVEQMLRDRLNRGASILLVTHDPAQARRLASRIVQIRGGVIVDRCASA